MKSGILFVVPLLMAIANTQEVENRFASLSRIGNAVASKRAYTREPVCKDDSNWVDSKYGSGKNKCVDMIPDWCENYGTYSTEAKAFCPLSCGVCSGMVFTKVCEQCVCKQATGTENSNFVSDCMKTCWNTPECKGVEYLPGIQLAYSRQAYDWQDCRLCYDTDSTASTGLGIAKSLLTDLDLNYYQRMKIKDSLFRPSVFVKGCVDVEYKSYCEHARAIGECDLPDDSGGEYTKQMCRETCGICGGGSIDGEDYEDYDDCENGGCE